MEREYIMRNNKAKGQKKKEEAATLNEVLKREEKHGEIKEKGEKRVKETEAYCHNIM